MPRLMCWLLAFGGGCAARAPKAKVTARWSGPQTPTPVTSAIPRTVAVSAPPATITAAPAPLDAHFERELTAQVSSIALGEGTRIAVLADVPYVGDARGLHALPLPSPLRARSDQTDEMRIFFGRDKEPRLMGSRRSPAGEASIYWRHTTSGWKDGREEIGQLGGSTRGGLWGVLGSADPELVCRAGSVCIIKRTSGWTSAPAGSAARRVEFLNGALWGLDASGLANIDAHGWSLAFPAPAWAEPRAFWVVASDEAWVATASELFHFHERAWSKAPSPIAEPAAFWGARPDSIWLVGRGGAAHFDGHAWRALTIAGPIAVVCGRNESELWLGGAAGLFRLNP